MRDTRYESALQGVFTDVVAASPEPPSWAVATATVQGAPRRAWYMRAWLAPVAAVAVVGVVGLAVLVGSMQPTADVGHDVPVSTQPTPQVAESLEGLWFLDRYTMLDGSGTTVMSYTGQFTPRSHPWIEFTDESVEGYTGCNRFAGPLAEISRGKLLLPVAISTRGCEPPNPSTVFLSIFEEVGGVDVWITATHLRLKSAIAEFSFVKADQLPTSDAFEWSVSAGDLECEGSVALNHLLTDPAASVTQMLTAVPGVVAVDERAEFDWSIGYGTDDEPLATVIAGDMEPRIYHRSSCAEQWGLLSDADLGGAVLTWINETGLNESGTDTWSDRFVELCASDPSDHESLAIRYIEEDADKSIRAGGNRPTAAEATGALQTIVAMTCGTDADTPEAMFSVRFQGGCQMMGDNCSELVFYSGGTVERYRGSAERGVAPEQTGLIGVSLVDAVAAQVHAIDDRRAFEDELPPGRVTAIFDGVDIWYTFEGDPSWTLFSGDVEFNEELPLFAAVSDATAAAFETLGPLEPETQQSGVSAIGEWFLIGATVDGVALSLSLPDSLSDPAAGWVRFDGDGTFEGFTPCGNRITGSFSLPTAGTLQLDSMIQAGGCTQNEVVIESNLAVQDAMGALAAVGVVVRVEAVADHQIALYVEDVILVLERIRQ